MQDNYLCTSEADPAKSKMYFGLGLSTIRRLRKSFTASFSDRVSRIVLWKVSYTESSCLHIRTKYIIARIRLNVPAVMKKKNIRRSIDKYTIDKIVFTCEI